MRMLQTRACDIFGHLFHLDAFSTVHTVMICMCFSRAFSDRCVFDENTQRVDRMPKRIEIYGLSYESTLVWTGHKRLLILKWAIAFNPLSPNIHIQILQTDLHTFPS